MKKFIIILALLSLLGCKDTSPGPPKIDPPSVKDPRTYTWRVDTISYPGSFQTSMYDIWGSSPNDVYVVGHNERGVGKMFHYDGSSWEPVRLITAEGGLIPGGIDLFSVYGFGGSNIFAVGERMFQFFPSSEIIDSSLIIHFDGSRWREVPISRGRRLYTIWGKSDNSLFAGGSGGTFYSFDGNTWSRSSLDSAHTILSISGTTQGSVYAVDVRYAPLQPFDSISYYLSTWNGAGLTYVDSFQITPQNLFRKFGFFLWHSPSFKFYSSGYGVYLKEGGQWNQLFWNESPLRIRGNADNNIWAVGDFGRIFHWNGSDWKRMREIEIPNVGLRSAWIFPNAVFILGIDGQQSYVLHGK